MKTKLLYLCCIVSAVVTSFVFMSYSLGPTQVIQLGYTGAPGEQSNEVCADCHTGGNYGPVVEMLTIYDNTGTAVSSYVPGDTYSVTLELMGSNNPVAFGFQMTALDDSANNAGSWLNLPTGIQESISIADTINNNRVYIEHSQPSVAGSFAVNWQAPAAGTGDVTFYFVGNLVDGQNGAGGDNGGSGSALTLTEFSVFPYTEDFEASDGGWTVGGVNPSWEWGQPAGLVINSAANGLNAWVTDLDSLYNTNEQSVLESPSQDFSSVGMDPQLSFSIYYDTEAGFDGCFVESSIDGGMSWQKVGSAGTGVNWYNSSTDDWWEGNSGGWITASNILTGTAGQSDVRIRFVMFSDVIVVADGIGIDDILIDLPPPDDIGVVDIITPSSGCQLGSETIEIVLQNFGANVQTGFNVNYSINGGMLIVENFSGMLLPMSTTTFAFPAPADLSAPGQYTITASTVLGSDADNTNDSYSIIVENFAPVTSFPYIEDFEGFSPCGANFTCNFDCSGATVGGWIQDKGDNDDWRIHFGPTPSTPTTGPVLDHNPGTPTGNYLYTEASGGCTNNTSTLVSPCIDITSLTNPALDFYMHRHGADMGSLTVDISLDNGLSWMALYSASGPFQTIPEDPWERVSVDLSAFTGTITLRWQSTTGGGFNSDLAIDNIRIGNSLTCVEPSAVTVSNIDTSSAEISWTSPNATFTSAIIEYGPTGFVLGTGDIMVATMNPVILTGLLPATSYDIYVREVCAAGDTSNYSGIVSFDTECLPFDGDDLATAIVVNMLPFSQINTTEVCFTNQNIARDGVDVFYQITTSNCADSIRVSTCSDTTAFDTYVYLLDEFGTEIASNDDAIPGACPFTLGGLNRFSILEAPITPNTTYVVVVDGFNAGALGAFEVEIVELTAPVVVDSLANVTCNGLNDGVIMVTPTGGVPPYTFDWGNGITDEDPTGLAPGVYQLTATDDNGCTFLTDPITITEPDALDLSSTVVMSDSIDLVVLGGTPPYTYLWSNGETTEDIGGLTPDTYSVTVTDSLGCTIASTFDTSVNIDEIEALQSMELLPNPTNSQTQLIVEFSQAVDMTIRLSNTLGQVLYERTEYNVWNNQYTLDMRNYAPGIYFVQLNVEGRIATKRLILTR